MQDTHTHTNIKSGQGLSLYYCCSHSEKMDEGKASSPQASTTALSLSKIMPSAAKIAVSKVSLFINPHIPLRIQLQKENRWRCWEDEEILLPDAWAWSVSTAQWLWRGPARSFHSQTTGVITALQTDRQALTCLLWHWNVKGNPWEG